MSLKERIGGDMKTAMRERDSARLGAVRLLLAAIKQKEIDERKDLIDADVISVIEKMVKQRRDSISQYEQAGRTDLADVEKFELSVLQAYLPEALGESEIEAMINSAIGESGAASAQEMGKVIAILRPKLAGRADMGKVSALVKARLSK